jgi:betaine reductase
MQPEHIHYFIFIISLGKEKLMAILNGKKVIVIGDRDGIPGPAIAECAESAGAEVVFSSTECFV